MRRRIADHEDLDVDDAHERPLRASAAKLPRRVIGRIALQVAFAMVRRQRRGRSR
jgi:hypothetical protein